jgi:DNA-binding transcriptional MerR regulator
MFYTSKQISELAGVTVMTVSRWKKLGFIKPVNNTPRATLYLKEEIDLFISTYYPKRDV